MSGQVLQCDRSVPHGSRIMGRPLRLDFAVAVSHVTGRGKARPLFHLKKGESKRQWGVMFDSNEHNPFWLNEVERKVIDQNIHAEYL